MLASSPTAKTKIGLAVSTRAHAHRLCRTSRICSNCHATVRAERSLSLDTMVKCGLFTSTQERSATTRVWKAINAITIATTRRRTDSMPLSLCIDIRAALRRRRHEHGGRSRQSTVR